MKSLYDVGFKTPLRPVQDFYCMSYSKEKITVFESLFKIKPQSSFISIQTQKIMVTLDVTGPQICS